MMLVIDLLDNKNGIYIEALQAALKKQDQFALQKHTPIEINVQGKALWACCQQSFFLFNKLGRKNKPHKNYEHIEHLYISEDEELGSGSFSCVVPLPGAWRLVKGQAPELKLKSDPGKKRVAKIYHREKSTDCKDKSSIIRESYISALVPHLGADLPLLNQKNEMLLLMRQIPGRELFAIIKDMANLPDYYPPTLRLRLSLNLLQQIENEILSVKNDYGQRLIHCDLKPENIMVSGGDRCHIIDYGLWGWEGEKKKNLSGTDFYVDSDNLHRLINGFDMRPLDEAVVIFAYAAIFLFIWGEYYRYDLNNYGSSDGELIRQLNTANNDLRLHDFLVDIPGLSSVEEQKLKTMAINMMQLPLHYRLKDPIKIKKSLTELLLGRYLRLTEKTASKPLNAVIAQLKSQIYPKKPLSPKLDSNLQAAEVLIDLLANYPMSYLGINLRDFIEARLTAGEADLAQVLEQLNQSILIKINELVPRPDPKTSLGVLQTKFINISQRDLVPSLRAYRLLGQGVVLLKQLEAFDKLNKIHADVPWSCARTPLESLVDIPLLFRKELDQFRKLYRIDLKVIDNKQGDPLDALVPLCTLQTKYNELIDYNARSKALIESYSRVFAKIDIAPRVYLWQNKNGYDKVYRILVEAIELRINNALAEYEASHSSFVFFKKSPKREETVRQMKADIHSLLTRQEMNLSEVKTKLLALIEDAKRKTIRDHANTGFFKFMPLTQSRLAVSLNKLEQQFK